MRSSSPTSVGRHAHDGRAACVLPVQHDARHGPAQRPALEQLRAVGRPLAVRQNPPDDPPRSAPCPIFLDIRNGHRISSLMALPRGRLATAETVQTSAA